MGSSKYLVGLDIGTSSCKATLFSADGKTVNSASGSINTYVPHEGWSEQNPDEWWDVSVSLLKRLICGSGVCAPDIAGIGVDGQSWSAVAVSRSGEVLTNTPTWMDVRSADICAELSESIGEDDIFRLCGNPLKPGYTTPKIVWYMRNKPDVFSRTYKILQTNSFIVYRLTGELSHDLSQGYGLHFFDTRNLRIDGGMCSRFGIDAGLIPPLYASHEIIGTVTREAALATGLAAGTPVVAGGLDAACGTLGAGVVAAGSAQEQGGQAGGMSLCMDEYRSDPRLILSPHVVPGTWLLQGGTVGGGGALRWFADEFCAEEKLAAGAAGRSVFALTDDGAAAVPPGSDGLVFLPYLSGERSPIWDESAKGVFFGLDYSKTRAHFVRAVMEGVAYSLRHNLEVAASAGAESDVLHSVGGGANSALWCGIKADVTGKAIAVASSDEATTGGAAMLAGVGTGVYKDFGEAADVFVKPRARYEPNQNNRDVYERGYSTYLELYKNLNGLMR